MAGEIEAAAAAVVDASGGGAVWKSVIGFLLALLGWKGYREIKGANGADRAVARQDDFQEDLLARINKVESRCDTFAAERNLALEGEAKAKGQLEALRGELDVIKSSRVEAKELVKKLGEQIDQLRDENERLKKRIAELEAHIRSCEGSRPEMATPLRWEDTAQ